LKTWKGIGENKNQKRTEYMYVAGNKKEKTNIICSVMKERQSESKNKIDIEITTIKIIKKRKSLQEERISTNLQKIQNQYSKW